MAARRFADATAVVAAGLSLAPDDPALIACRGDAKAGMRDLEGALADWRHAVQLDPGDIGPLYSSAFLLERGERLADAVSAWREIVDWNESRGYALQAEWPKRKLERLRERLRTG